MNTLAQHLARLGVNVEAVTSQLPADLTLAYHDGVLGLTDDALGHSPLVVDFIHGPVSFRSQQHLGGEHLIKACQIKGQKSGAVLDATCGLGTDSFLLQQAGFNVTATEQHPVIHALLRDGLYRFQHATGEGGFELHCGDARQLLNEQPFDVIYLDPMFPTVSKSAKNKKTMQLFQRLHETSVDNAKDLLEWGTEQPCQRVVIKRPVKAPLINQRKPTFQILGKTCRFDAFQLS